MKKLITNKRQKSSRWLLWKYDSGFDFSHMLKKIRLKKGLSRSQLGKLIGKEHYQIQRYEQPDGSPTKQIPPLPVFADLCVALQIDPIKLLGMKWVDAIKKPEPGVIYDWAIDKHEDLVNPEFNKMSWICPKCMKINYEYDAYSRKKKKFIRNEFMCEHCNTIYNVLMEAEDEK